MRLLFAAASVLSFHAFADEPVPNQSGSRAPALAGQIHVPSNDSAKTSKVEHYGLQSAALDLTAVGIGAASYGANSEPLGWIFFGTYLLGSPVVHLAHGEPGRALGSLGLRFVLPLVSGLVGSGLRSKSGPFLGDLIVSDAVATSTGVVIGAVAAMVIDDVFLARHEVRSEPSFAFSPSFDPVKKGASLNLSGTF